MKQNLFKAWLDDVGTHYFGDTDNLDHEEMEESFLAGRSAKRVAEELNALDDAKEEARLVILNQFNGIAADEAFRLEIQLDSRGL